MAIGETIVSEDKAVEVSPRELVHEFRNLLAVIVNYCELIADEINDPTAISADLQEIRTAAERALALTEKIPVPKAAASPEPPATAS